MSEVAVLTEFEMQPHRLDLIDEIAQQRAEELVDLSAETIKAEKARVVVDIYNKLLKQYQKRRIGDTTQVGEVSVEKDVIATRTASWERLDEVFERVTVYDPLLSQPLSSYRVEMLRGDDAKTVVELDPNGDMRFTRQQGEHVRNLTLQEANVAMLDLVYRAEMAVGAYEMRKEDAIKQGLDPSVYSDAADMHARHLLELAGYRNAHRASGD